MRAAGGGDRKENDGVGTMWQQHWRWLAAASVLLLVGGGLSEVEGEARAEVPEVEFVTVPGVDLQPVGPTYDFRISVFEIRNDQFAQFLNDALASLDNEHGAYLYFDIDSGDVYLNSTEEGFVGTAGTGTLLFDAGENEHLGYDEGEELYLVEAGYEDHPATGMSWYGAIKYCNWLTLISELDPEERCYQEAPSSNPGGWHPVTISDAAWASRDLDQDEREDLLALLGYRLPMDEGEDYASAYGEWYKAGAWDEVAGADYTYGFGRDVIGPGAANYRCSDDPFEDPNNCLVGGTTPVGFYDGTLYNEGGGGPVGYGQEFASTASENYYGLFDVSGNVWEWLQDQGSGASLRRTRGGSWRSTSTFLQLPLSSERAADAPADSTGLRVVQGVVSALMATPQADLEVAGPWGGPYADPGETSITYRITNVSAEDLTYSMQVDAWLSVDGGAPVAELITRGETQEITVQLDLACADGLIVGQNLGTVTISNESDPEADDLERFVVFTVSEPLTLSAVVGQEEFATSMRYGAPPADPADKVYRFESNSDAVLYWSAQWEETTGESSGLEWLTLNGVPVTGGSVPVQGEADVTVAVSDAEAGLLDVGVYTAEVTFSDTCTDTEWQRAVTLEVLPWFSIVPGADLQATGPEAGPFVPDEFLFDLTNLDAEPINWEAALDPPETDWLELDQGAGTLAGLAGVQVEASLTTDAWYLTPGTHEVAVRFEHNPEGTGFSLARKITLEVTDWVSPDEDVSFTRPEGGLFSPADVTFTLVGNEWGEREWLASFAPDQPEDGYWLDVDPTFGSVQGSGGFVEVTLTPNAVAGALNEGVYTGVLTFTDTTFGDKLSTRAVTLVVGAPIFSLQMALVPAEDGQPDNPAYPFRIGRYEVRNTEYALFLNDAYHHVLNGAADARASYMYFDTDSGDVYLGSNPLGEVGTGGAGTLLYDASVGRAQLTDEAYVMEAGYLQHPVVGVSWYGAVKFCNWLTFRQGMPAEMIYAEGATADAWVSNTADPATLVTYAGFRLPQDDGYSQEAVYNEWYKAAAWLQTFGVYADYGFGRDTLLDADANYYNSGDSQTETTTVVGFFNGENYLQDGITLTNNTSNGYGLYDITGNVAEWLHDIGVIAQERTVRGGHFNNPHSSPFLRSDEWDSQAAQTIDSFTGFRVMQALPEALTTFDVSPAEPRHVLGYVGGDYDAGELAFTLSNDGNYTLDEVSVALDVGWLEVDGSTSPLVPPGGVGVSLKLSEAADSLSASPAPGIISVFVAAAQSQPGGPLHDYWISKYEITNTQFAGFLNDAYDDAGATEPGPCSEYMYFDVDSGSVYVNDQQQAAEGTQGGGGVLVTLMYAAEVGRIQLVEEEYEIESGYENHPVVGVSWYGALKYCNWLTLSEGLPANLRVYTEASSLELDGWHPVTVSTADWLAGNLDRQSVIERTVGYRLPMDEGEESASSFNEWYKAAAWDAAEGESGANHVYGFGRDTLDNEDANFACSGDPFEDDENCEVGGTSLLGFFNGVNSLSNGETVTSATENGFGILDLCGNAAEWVQGFLASGDPSARTTRGGSWQDASGAAGLRNMGRTGQAPEQVNGYTGFRVVRNPGRVAKITFTDALTETGYDRYVLLHLRAAFEVSPFTHFNESGTYGDDFSGLQPTLPYTLSNRSASDMDWQVSVDQPWIDLDGPVPDELGGTLEGAGSGNDAVDITVTTNEQANNLGPGTHQAVITFHNATTGGNQTRFVTITIGQPITVTVDNPPAEFSGVYGGPFEEPVYYTFTLGSEVVFDLDYEVNANQTWIDLDGTPSTGILYAGGELIFEVSIGEGAGTLAVDDYTANISFAFIDDDVSDALTEKVKLTVRDPLALTPAGAWDAVLLPGNSLPAQAYNLENQHTSESISVLLEADAEWITLSDDALLIEPGQMPTVQVDVNEGARLLYDGEYQATLSFTDTLTGEVQDCDVNLSVNEDLSVAPRTDFSSYGIKGAAVAPSAKVYTLANYSGATLDWSVQAQGEAVDWLRLNGEAAAAGTLADGDSVQVVVTLEPDAEDLVEGLNQAVLDFNNATGPQVFTRTVSLTLVVPEFSLREMLVSSSVVQAGGPSYGYELAQYHTTNEEFVAFLNDAVSTIDPQRCGYMFFDTATGDVYVNTSVTRELGADPGARVTKMFDPAVAGQIAYDGQEGRYEVVTGYEEHPVAGVSWYGALKYCNWLTLDQGFDPAQRCYEEATAGNLAGWHPVTISTADWSIRDLDDNERYALVQGYRGYRLPMDEGANNPDPALDFADGYNEWYKGAAWNSVLGHNTEYGFGRDTLTTADANYYDSGDPLDNSTTPVGYYDGSDHGGAFATDADENTFEVFDMSGNVYQWVQGRFYPGSLTTRAVRGGSFNTQHPPPGSQSLKTSRRSAAAPELVFAEIGFRVLRTLVTPDGDSDLDGDVDLDDATSLSACVVGEAAGLLPNCGVFDFDADTDVDLRDVAAFQRLFNP